MKKANLLTIILALTMATGCGDTTTTTTPTQTTTQTSTQGTTTSTNHLDFGCYKYSNSIDPIANINSSWGGVRYGVTECLFKFDEDVVAQPNLITHADHSDDFTVWTLHMIDDLKFSNGNLVTPTAVVASIERLYRETDPDQGGTGNSKPSAYLVFDSIVADDAAGTVTITCPDPMVNMAGVLSYPYFAIVDVEFASTEIIGTGPYKIDKNNEDINIELSKNTNYRTHVPYDTINVIYVEDNSTKAMALQSGDIQLTENITSASALADLTSNPEAYAISTAAGVRTGNSYINHDGVLSNDALRQAVMYALDDQTMCDITVGGMYTSGISVLPSSLAYNYDQLVDPYSFNTEKAIQILDDAGIVDTDGDGIRELDGVNINLDYNAFTSRNLNEFAQAVAIQLGDIGIGTTVNVRDYDSAQAIISTGQYDLSTANTTTVGTGDPQEFLGNWYTDHPGNVGNYSNSDYDELYSQLLLEVDADTRVDIITKLQQILIDDAATIVHGYYNSRLLSRTDSVVNAEIATIDYYWITTDITPLQN